jgi:very-short-patch-repair endonuclease
VDKADVFQIYWDMLAPLNLRELVREYHFAEERGREYRADFAFPSQKVLVEVDGGNRLVRYSEKSGRYVAVGKHTQEDDYEKLNLAAVLGYRVLRFTPKQLEDAPAQCVELVVKALERKEIKE